jgi:hypothetical protein
MAQTFRVQYCGGKFVEARDICRIGGGIKEESTEQGTSEAPVRFTESGAKDGEK